MQLKPIGFLLVFSITIPLTMVACNSSSTPNYPLSVVSPSPTAIPTAITSPTSPTATQTLTNTPVSTYTPSSTPTPINTYTNTNTPTLTATNTITNTPTISPTPSNTATSTISSTPTNTPTVTSTNTSVFQFKYQWSNTFIGPSGIACAGASIYLADNYSNGKIEAFNSTSTPTNNWSVPPPASGSPTGLAVDGAGNVYMADSTNNLIREFNPAGAPVTTYNGGSATFNQPSALAVDSTGTTIYVADSGNNQIQKLILEITPAATATPGSTPVTVIAQSQWGNGTLSYPEGIAASVTNVYVSDTLNNRIVIYNTDGSGPVICGGPGTGNLQFSGPIGLALNSSNHLFVADFGNKRVQVLTSVGSYFNQFGSSSNAGGNGILKGPEGIAVDGSNNIYVVDTTDNLVQVFH